MPSSSRLGKAVVLGAIAFMLFAATIPIGFLIDRLGSSAIVAASIPFGVGILAFFLYRGQVVARRLTVGLLAVAALGLLVAAIVSSQSTVPVFVLVAGAVISAFFAVLLTRPAAQGFLNARLIAETPAPVPVFPEELPSLALVDDPVSPPAAPLPVPGSALAASERWKSAWMYEFSCILLCLGLVMSGVYALKAGSHDDFWLATAAGGLIGAGILAFLFAWPLWRFLHKKKRGAGLLWFAALVPGFLVLAVVGESTPKPMPVAAKETLQSLVRHVAQEQDVRAVSIDNDACGAWAPFLRITRSWYADIQDAAKRFQNEQAEAHTEDIFTPDVAADAGRIQDARQRVKRAIDSVIRVKADMTALIETFPERYRAMRLPSREAEAILKGMREGVRKQVGAVVSLRETQLAMLREYDATLAFLESNQGGYSVKDRRIFFNSTDGLKIYNAHLTEARRLEAEQQRILDRLKSDALKSASQLSQE